MSFPTIKSDPRTRNTNGDLSKVAHHLSQYLSSYNRICISFIRPFLDREESIYATQVQQNFILLSRLLFFCVFFARADSIENFRYIYIYTHPLLCLPKIVVRFKKKRKKFYAHVYSSQSRKETGSSFLKSSGWKFFVRLKNFQKRRDNVPRGFTHKGNLDLCSQILSRNIWTGRRSRSRYQRSL